jgi:uncharacterized protein
LRFDWLVLGIFLVALIADHLVVWRAFTRSHSRDATQARRVWSFRTALMLWACSALVLALWERSGWPQAMFEVPYGWRLWGPLSLTAIAVGAQVIGAIRIARMTEDKGALRAKLGSTGQVVPHDASELPAWFAMSVTAGFCEELLFRGFLIWMLQPFAGWWVAAAASLAVFAAAHAYQGVSGVARSAIIGAVMTAIVFVSQSLWPAIALHAALDWMGGWIGWLIVRQPSAMQSASESLASR